MQLYKISLAILLSFGCVTISNAAVVDGGSTNLSNIKIGETGNPSPHAGGVVALSVASASSPWNMYIGFKALQGLAGSTHNENLAINGKNYQVTDIPVSLMPASHSALGNFNFVQVSDAVYPSASVTTPLEVFFGEWYASGDSLTGATHTAYYGGDNTGRIVPTIATGGTAEYKITGVNGYNASSKNLLVGSATANFGTATLTGGLSGGTASTTDLSFTAGIDASSGAFAGIASANGGTVTGGVVSGSFYGNNGSAVGGSLAGAVDFGSTTTTAKYNTAFGGTQISYNP